jgi:DNA-binding response OmpR family regulator
VDDEDAVRALRRALLSEVGFDVMDVSAGKSVIRRIARMSGTSGSYLEGARRFGANAIFQKPLDLDEVLDFVRGLLEAALVGRNPTARDCE